MEVHHPLCEFGWEGDDGLGERLIQQIISGTKTATCSFRKALTIQELADIVAGEGHIVTVVDHLGAPRCNIRISDVFACTFGDPDPRLVAGEGDGDDVAKFQADHRIAWEATVPDVPLTDDAVLVVELFELVEVAVGLATRGD